MKKNLLPTLLAVFVILTGSLKASNDNKTVTDQIIYNMCVDKKLAAAIVSLKEMIIEIKNKRIQYEGSRVVKDYWVGNTNHIITHHYYNGDGDIIDVVERYQHAFNELSQSNMVLAIGDGAILGVLMSIISKMCKLSDKSAGISIAVASALLTLIKYKNTAKVPYLDYRTLKQKDNFFGAEASLSSFVCTVGAGLVSYLGTNFLMDRVSGKVTAVKDGLSAENAHS